MGCGLSPPPQRWGLGPTCLAEPWVGPEPSATQDAPILSFLPPQTFDPRAHGSWAMACPAQKPSREVFAASAWAQTAGLLGGSVGACGTGVCGGSGCALPSPGLVHSRTQRLPSSWSWNSGRHRQRCWVTVSWTQSCWQPPLPTEQELMAGDTERGPDQPRRTARLRGPVEQVATR